MKKVGSGGFSPTLQKLVKDASESGKQIGAPKLNKALNGLHLGQLKKMDQSQLRDLFESAPLTSKARALAEKLLNGGDGRVKVKMDEPTPTQPPTVGTKPPLVKVKMDEPTPTQPPIINTQPPLVKVKMDEPTPVQPPIINTQPPLVKVKMDEPTPIQPSPITPSLPVVKVKMDEPTGF
ncbi:hypothetical protein NR798_07325 [Archangium gephyra]|uniref:hypothetical protein n=1 Tax=Archangium gephyra TaxID=48 RepID=UPI0035D408F1